MTQTTEDTFAFIIHPIDITARLHQRSDRHHLGLDRA